MRTEIQEEHRMGRFSTPNIEGTLRLSIKANKIARREVNICNPLEFEAYHLQEGYTRNIVLTSNDFVFEITPKEIKKYTIFDGYGEQGRVALEQEGGVYFNHVLGVLEGSIHDAFRSSKMIVIEKNVRSPFINNIHESAKS